MDRGTRGTPADSPRRQTSLATLGSTLHSARMARSEPMRAISKKLAPAEGYKPTVYGNSPITSGQSPYPSPGRPYDCNNTAASAFQLTYTSSLQSMDHSEVRRSFCENTVTNFPLAVLTW
jgi:hypothetical protein